MTSKQWLIWLIAPRLGTCSSHIWLDIRPQLDLRKIRRYSAQYCLLRIIQGEVARWYLTFQVLRTRSCFQFRCRIMYSRTILRISGGSWPRRSKLGGRVILLMFMVNKFREEWSWPRRSKVEGFVILLMLVIDKVREERPELHSSGKDLPLSHYFPPKAPTHSHSCHR